MGFLKDWLEHAREQMMDSITCQFESMDPADVTQRAEEQFIEATGFNFNQHPTEE